MGSLLPMAVVHLALETSKSCLLEQHIPIRNFQKPNVHQRAFEKQDVQQLHIFQYNVQQDV
jgi:hypothetical protein